jgi:hypothetical protein
VAEALVLEFDGVGRDVYESVSALLGIDAIAGTGDWPAGLQTHAAGPTDSGWAVLEIWESREAQQQFMDGRLGQALQAGGGPPPSRITWVSLVAHHVLPG